MGKKRKKQNTKQKETIQIKETTKNNQDIIVRAEKLGENKYIKYGWIALLIIIVIIISAYVRLGPLNLPITDTWAEQQIEGNIKGSIEQQVRQERGNLPEASIQRLVEEEYSAFYETNKETIDAQKATLSQQYKTVLQNDNGMTYLLGIDEYYFYSHAKWYQKNKAEGNAHFGTDIIDGESRFMLRNGRFGFVTLFEIHPFLINVVHDVWKPFNSNFNIEWASFYIAVIIIGLSAIPLFFLNKKISGTTGAFIASILVLTAVPLVGRTLGGSSDNDVHTILFTFTMLALLFTALGKKTKTIAIMAGIAGLVNAVFMITWSGWWYGYLLVLGSAGLYLVYDLIVKYVHKKKLTLKEIMQSGAFFAVFLVSAIIFAMLISPLSLNNAGEMASQVITAPGEPVKLLLRLEAGADLRTLGESYPLWPNVLRTVAELNPANFKQIISGAGTLPFLGTGIMFFYIAILGIITLFIRTILNFKEEYQYAFYGLVLLVWMFGMILVAKSAVRFILMASIPILIGAGALIGTITGPVAKYLNKEHGLRKSLFIGVASIILVLWFLITPIASARKVSEGAIPLFDDAWYDSIYALKADASQYNERAIISSWWDYGHFFQAYGEQTVTFDGADQGKRVYWMGRTLVTEDVDEAHDILKVMNCGQEKSYDVLEEYIGERFKATQIMLEITRMNREEARAYLQKYLTEEQTRDVLELTHCEDLRPMYYITSGDMVGKAGVWSHFGGWNFTRAYFYYHLKNLPITEVYSLTEEKLNMSQEETRNLYNHAKLLRSEQEAAQWISPYLNYVTGKTSCTQTNQTITCDYNLGLQQTEMSTTVLRRAVIPLNELNNTQIIIQEINRNTGTPLQQHVIKPNRVILERNGSFEEHKFETPEIGYDLVIMEEPGKYTSLMTTPQLSKSVFTRLFFMEGRGQDLEMFEKINDVTSFRGERIIVWKVHP